MCIMNYKIFVEFFFCLLSRALTNGLSTSVSESILIVLAIREAI
jgi:hypothetical protein